MPWTFIIGALALSVLALAFVLFPLLRGGAPGQRGRSRREVNQAVHQERLAELDQDLENGTLDREQYDQAVADLERDLVQSGALGPDEDRVGTAGRRRRLPLATAGGAVVAIPLAAVLVYSSVGDPRGFQQSAGQLAGSQPPAAEAPHDMEQFEQLAEQLYRRLQQEPEDVGGWAMLGRTWLHLEQFDRARDAFGEALAHGGDRDPDLLSEYADVLAEVDGELAGRPEELVRKALEIDPDHVRALWLAGTAAYQESDYETARGHWEHLLDVLPPTSSNAQIIRANLEAIEARPGG